MGAAGKAWVSVEFSAHAYRARMTELYGELVG
jgi:hypothetical protein